MPPWSPCSSCGIAERDFAINTVADLSSFQYLVKTNDPPPASEAQRLRNILQEAHDDIGRLDRKVARLLAAAKEVQEERDAFQRSIDPYTAIVSPIRRIPPEVIMMIFAHLREPHYEVYITSEGPWVLALLRTGQRELEIDFPRNFKHFDVMEPHYSRFKRIDCSFTPSSLLSGLARFKQPYPSLTQMSITVLLGEDLTPFETETVVDAFEHTPRLRTLSLCGFLQPEKVFRLPWDQLTVIELKDIDISVMSNILRLVPGLEKLKISLRENLDESDVRQEPIPGALPSKITLPNLYDVTIGRESGPGLKCPMVALATLSELLRRSRCGLKQLSLSNVEMSHESSVFELLQSASSITHLHVACMDYDREEDEHLSAFIKTLVYKYDPSIEMEGLLPNLEVLEVSLGVGKLSDVRFTDAGTRTSVMKGLCALLDSRTLDSTYRGPHAPSVLRKFIFRATHTILPGLRYAEIEALKRHKANGMDVSVTTKRPTFHEKHDSPELHGGHDIYLAIDAGRVMAKLVDIILM